MSSSEPIVPFRVAIPQSAQDRLLAQLASSQPPTEDLVENTGEDYGIPTKWAHNLLNHWKTTFSWPQAEAAINSIPQFTTEIEGLTIHFAHQRSIDPNAIPILLVHGWPGSFYEFSSLIPLLTDPSTSSSGGKAQMQTFHCIAPSLPGFCFSSSPRKRGWTVKDTARVFHTLMQRLGYPSYAVQAGDWGQFVARELGANPAYASTGPNQPGCKLIHLNWCPGTLPSDPETPYERTARDRGVNWRTQHIGYAVLMRTRPQSLEWMLADNAVGTMVFVGEKYQEAAAPATYADPAWLEHVCVTVSLYYFTRCIGSSALVYFENPVHDRFAEYVMREENRIRVPLGYTSFAFDTAPNTRRAVERTGRLVMYGERDYAGHFAALEDPKGVAEDVREVVAGWWAWG